MRDGVYRFRVDPNGAMSFLVVREGQAEIIGGGHAFTINSGNSVLVSGADQPTFDVENAPAPDGFDNRCSERDAREVRAASRRYLPPTVSIATGPSLGWVPLGFGEVFTPAYACSRHYFSNVNIYNTRIVKDLNITNVYNTVYVNKTACNQQFVNIHAPNAVYAMHSSAFADSQPVHRAGFALSGNDLQQIERGTAISPGVAPVWQAFFTQGGRPAMRPVSQVVSRQVVAVSTPEQRLPPPAAQPQHERPRMEHSEPRVKNRLVPQAQHTSPPASHGEQHHDCPPEYNINSGQHGSRHNERRPQ